MKAEQAISAVEAHADHFRTGPEGHQIQWHRWGEGPPLILTHGSFGSWLHWIRNVETLAARHAVYTLDLPGMGDSDLPAGPSTLDNLGAEVANGIAEALPDDARFDMVGFSFGGIVGGQAATHLGGRVKSLMVIGSNALGLKVDERPPLRSPSRDMSEKEIREVHRHNLAIVMFETPASVDELALEIQFRNTRRARVRSGAIPRGDGLAQALCKLAKDVPIAGVWGEADAMTGRYRGEREALFAALDAPFHVVPGAGHWAQYEQAGTVNGLIGDWLADRPG